MEDQVRADQNSTEQIGFDWSRGQEENLSRFKAFLRRELRGHNREVALKSFWTERTTNEFGQPMIPEPLDLVTVAFTYDYHWRHRKGMGIENDAHASMGGLRALFHDMGDACRNLAKNAQTFRASAAAQRWVRPEPQVGSPVYSLDLRGSNIPELWKKADADQLLGSSRRVVAPGEDSPPEPPLLTRLQDLARLFSVLESEAKRLTPEGAKTIFEGEDGRLIEQMHFNCLLALHGHGVDTRCFRPITWALHWWVTGHEPPPEWGKRQATQARMRFKAHLEQTSRK